MKNLHPSYLKANVEQFDGFADLYNTFRPAMPPIIVDVLTQVTGIPFPDTVVDAGCGTGLSTRTWIGRAEHIIGIEPSDDMRSKAEELSQGHPSISYKKGTATEMGLDDECADVVTLCQAIGWVEPTATFAEIYRILRPKGIFASVDYDVPATTTIEIQILERAFQKGAEKLMANHLPDHQAKHWDKANYLSQMASSGKFSYTTECAVYGKRDMNAEQIVGLNRSHAATQTLLKSGLTEDDIGLTHLRAELRKILGDSSIGMYFTYVIRIGQK